MSPIKISGLLSMLIDRIVEIIFIETTIKSFTKMISILISPQASICACTYAVYSEFRSFNYEVLAKVLAS